MTSNGGEPKPPAATSSCGDATVNPCTLCAPLGAALAAAGIEGTMPLLHGGQGCATYIRRYLISHFREPVDIASSSFGETQTVFGGEDNLSRALDNIERQYHPKLVAVATTCVAETVGEDVPMMVKRYNAKRSNPLPVVQVSSPSYKDGHIEGYHAMVLSIVKALAVGEHANQRSVNVLPPMLSPADLRHLRELVQSFGVEATVLPDYSETLDGIILSNYRAMPEGGTPIDTIAKMPAALATLDLTLTGTAPRASVVLQERGVRADVLGLPIGIPATDAFIASLEGITGSACPDSILRERGRLLDAYADGHKYVAGKRVAVFGDPELVASLARFLTEIGAKPVVCATGARNRALPQALQEAPAVTVDEVLDDTDFDAIEAACRRTGVELMLGNSKGYPIARRLGIPLIRIGFPIHDRIGANRVQLLGYRGSIWLFDALVNAILQHRQDTSDVGYAYL